MAAILTELTRVIQSTTLGEEVKKQFKQKRGDGSFASTLVPLFHFSMYLYSEGGDKHGKHLTNTRNITFLLWS